MLVLGATLVLASTAGAATFTVNATDDMSDAWPGNGACQTSTGACTLRAAVQEANAHAGADTIVVPAGRYELGLGGIFSIVSQLSLLDDVTITGAGARKTVVHANPASIANGIFVSPQSSTHVALSGMTISGGSSSGSGGAIYNGGAMSLSGVIVRDSSASYAGGGIATAGPLVVSASTIAFNSARRNGGGVAVLSGGSLAATNTTISGNTVTGHDAEDLDGTGAAISNVHGTVALTNVTVAGNSSADRGGGALSGAVTLTNTILANPTATGDCAAYALGAPSSKGHNLSGDATCRLTGPGDQPSTNALVATLAPNSGPTDTHELLPGSPALDAADAAACPTADQRGVPRPLGAGCDIGALEHVPVADLSVNLTDKPDPIPADDDLTYTLTVGNAGPDPAFDSQVHHDIPPGVVLIAVPQNCSVLGGQISCALGALPAGATYTASVIVRPETLGALTSVADVTTTSLDPVTSGNVATAATLVLNRLLGHLRNRSGQVVVPEQGRTVVADVVKGVVLVRKPGDSRFMPLDGADSIPVGSTFDTTGGQVRLTSATDANGNIQSSIFYGGQFRVAQKPGHPLVTLKLVGGSFRSCRVRAATKRIALHRMAHASAAPVARAARRVARTAQKPRKANNSSPKRQVWGKTDGKAKYKTQGKYAAATVRGTIWLTQDRCDGTLVKVRRGLVAVRDLKRKKTKLVPAGHQVLVRAKKARR